jgi:transketolase
MFSPGRNWEQIRTTICYNDRNVKIAGAHAGISVGPDGGTHQALEDIAIMRIIPNMRIMYPCDAIEAKKATLSASRIVGPVYLRFAREKTPVMTTDETPFEFGHVYTYFESQGKDIRIGIIASGPLLFNALSAAKKLDEEGIGVRVMNLTIIKPLPEEDILRFSEGLSGIVSVEEHQIFGGVSGALAELFVEKKPIKMAFIGVRDLFGQSGEMTELIEHYGMGISAIGDAARKLL